LRLDKVLTAQGILLGLTGKKPQEHKTINDQPMSTNSVAEYSQVEENLTQDSLQTKGGKTGEDEMEI